MISLTDIIPVRSIYFGSAFALMIYIMPFAMGRMIYHFTTRHWKRATLWIFLVFMVPSLFLATIFAMRLENVLYTPKQAIFSISCWLMLEQAFVWRLVWLQQYRKREMNYWRIVSITAFWISLAITISAFGAYYKERGQERLAEAHHQWQMSQDAKRFNEVGYVQYPGAEFVYGNYPVRGESEFGESITIHFRTDDLSEDVLEFYRKSALGAGLDSRIGKRVSTGADAMVAIGEESGMVVESGSGSDWFVTVYWDVSEDFAERVLESYEFEK